MAHGFFTKLLLYFFIAMLGAVLPLVAPSLDPAPIARAVETQCAGRTETVQRVLDQLTASLVVLERKIQPDSADSIDKGNSQIEQYMAILGTTRQRLQASERNLVQFSQNKCGKNEFEAFRTQ